MTAAEAKELTINSYPRVAERVKDLIRRSAESGETSLILQQQIPKEVADILKKEGYRLEKTTTSLHDIYRVRWD